MNEIFTFDQYEEFGESILDYEILGQYLTFSDKDYSKIHKLIGRFTAVTFLYYPDQDFIEESSNRLFRFLDLLGVPSAVSPLHDKDIIRIDEDTGNVEYKKPHYHVVIDYGSGNNKTFKQFFETIIPIRDHIAIAPFDKCGNWDKCAKIWIMNNKVRNMRTLLRYFKHLDNPEKFQYVLEEIRGFCGFDLTNKIVNQEDCISILCQIIDFCKVNDLYNFADLVDYCRENNREWFSVLAKSNSSFMLNYLKSSTFRNTGAQDKLVKLYESKDYSL